MPETKPKAWKRVVGYPLFFFFAAVMCFFLTFPYDALKDRIRNEADAAGFYVRIGSMGPGLFSVRASNVELSKKAKDDKPVEALKIDSVSVGPTLFPPGIGVTAKLMGGEAQVRISGITNNRVRIDLEDLDTTKGNLKGYSGIDFSGSIEAHVDLTVPRVASGPGPAEPDLGQASGTVTLETKTLTVNGGTVSVALPQFGPEPTPLDLPKIVLGDIDGKLKFEKGQGTIEDLKSKSPDIEFNATGTMKLAKRVDYSEPNIELRFKPDAEFQKRLGLIGSALSMVPSDPKDPTWRMGRLTGFVGRPRFP